MGASQKFMDAITSQLGVPYQWGGDTPATGFDCSGLPFWAAAQAGHPLAVRTSEAMFSTLPEVKSPTTGDLVFFQGKGGDVGHVGVCNNPGCTQMIDAPHTGAQVRMETVGPVGSIWGDDTVVGYRSIPNVTGQPVKGDPGKGSGDPGKGSGGSTWDKLYKELNPFSLGADAASAIEKPILEQVGQLPTIFMQTLLGDHTPGELIFRWIEFSGGLIVIVGGLYCFAKVLMDQTHTNTAVDNVYATGKRTTKSIKGQRSSYQEQKATLTDKQLGERAKSEQAENRRIATEKRKGTSSPANPKREAAKKYGSSVAGTSGSKVLYKDGSTF